MKFERRDTPLWAPGTSVASQMLQVLAALVPAAAAHVWYCRSASDRLPTRASSSTPRIKSPVALPKAPNL